jgi:enoyl-CoA hydratase/carnithine racemase
MSSDAVLYEPAPVDTVHAHIGVLRLNRPDGRNSMTAELLDAFAARLLEVRQDQHLRCLVITGSGSCFSAGADLKAQIQRTADTFRFPHEASFAMYTAFLGLLDVEVPVIGALNGHTVGGGFGLALLCDVRVGSLSARYGANFTRLGLHPGMAITYTLPRLIGLPRASELLYTGRLVTGDEAERLGILSRAVPAEDVLPTALEVAAAIAASAPLAVRQTKATLMTGLAHEIREAARREAFAQAATVTTEDFKEGMAALFDKREPAFKGR